MNAFLIFGAALIHDDSIDLPKKSMEAWTQVIVENWIFQCPTPISANIIYLDPKTDLNKELTQMNCNITTISLINSLLINSFYHDVES